jgi:tripartite ATP-independent transporter DctP family solute receptor
LFASQFNASNVEVFLKNMLWVLLAIYAFHSISEAQAQQKSYKIGYILSRESQLGAGATAFAEEVAKRTGGRVTIEQQPNAVLGGEVEMLKGLQLGTVDMAFITGAPLPTIVPEVGVFNIPFIFRDANHAHTVLDGPLGQAYLAKFKEKNLVALAWGENGLRHITNSKRPIVHPEDLKGLKLRLPQSEVMLTGFKTLGADVFTLPFPQLYGALQSGQYDGQENPIATILSSKFSQVQKYLTLSGHVYDPAVILVSSDVWSDLNDEERAALMEAAKIGAMASCSFAAEAQRKGVETLRQQGMVVVDGIDRAQFVNALAAARPEYEQKFGTAVITQIEDTK